MGFLFFQNGSFMLLVTVQVWVSPAFMLHGSFMLLVTLQVWVSPAFMLPLNVWPPTKNLGIAFGYRRDKNSVNPICTGVISCRKLYWPSGTVTLVQSALPGNSAGCGHLKNWNANVKSEGLIVSFGIFIDYLFTYVQGSCCWCWCWCGAGFPVPPAVPVVAVVDWRFLLWSLNPEASLSFPIICCPWFAWLGSSLLYVKLSWSWALGSSSFCLIQRLPWLKTWSRLFFCYPRMHVTA